MNRSVRRVRGPGLHPAGPVPSPGGSWRAIRSRKSKHKSPGLALFRAPGPHPTLIIPAIPTEPFNARGRLAVRGLARKELQADRADFERLRMPVCKSGNASLEVAADGALWIVIVITLVGRHPPIERLLIAHLDPIVRIALERIANEAGVGKRKFLHGTLQSGQLGPPVR